MTIHVSGRMRMLFERHDLTLEGEPSLSVPAFRCRWCGFTAVIDAADELPDHACSGPVAKATYRGEPAPPMSHSQ
jgi:hypothetical protein